MNFNYIPGMSPAQNSNQMALGALARTSQNNPETFGNLGSYAQFMNDMEQQKQQQKQQEQMMNLADPTGLTRKILGLMGGGPLIK